MSRYTERMLPYPIGGLQEIAHEIAALGNLLLIIEQEGSRGKWHPFDQPVRAAMRRLHDLMVHLILTGLKPHENVRLDEVINRVRAMVDTERARLVESATQSPILR